MTKEQMQQFEYYSFGLKCNRDNYSKAKIIELLVEKVKLLAAPAVSKSEDIEREALLLAYNEYISKITKNNITIHSNVIKGFLSQQ